MTLAPKPAQLEAPGIYRQAPLELVRCLCPECLRLDAQHPGEGYQLTFEPYRFTVRNSARYK